MKKKHPIPLAALSLPALAVLTLAVAGCAPKPTIVGKWQGVFPLPNKTMNALFEFTPDNKETITVTTVGRTASIIIHGTYAVDGANLTQSFTTMTAGGRTQPAPPSSSRPAPFTLDGSHLRVLDPAGRQSLTLTRVKE